MSEPETEAAAKLPILALLADVWRVYRRHWKTLVPLAVVVLLPQALGDAVEAKVDTDNLDAGRALIAAAGFAGIVGTNLAGEALYAGIITALVVSWRHGPGVVGLRQRLRELPLLRLIVADVLIAAGTALGLVLLLVPGIVFATYTLVTTVIIELERTSVIEGIRRSVELVRGSFWRVLAIGVVLLVGTDAITYLLVSPFHGFAIEAAVHLGAEALLEPFQGVAIVLVGLGLKELRGEPPPQ